MHKIGILSKIALSLPPAPDSRRTTAITLLAQSTMSIRTIDFYVAICRVTHTYQGAKQILNALNILDRAITIGICPRGATTYTGRRISILYLTV